MSNIVVITFDNADEAGEARKAIKKMEKQGQISLDDSAVVVKDEDGKIHVKNEVDRGVKVGAGVGGLLGLFIALVTAPFGFPLAALVLGVAGGAGVGALTDLGIQKKFVKQVSEAIKPNTSALFVIVRDSNPAAAVAVLKPFKGDVYHTSLPPEAEETLRRVLSKREGGASTA